jgi:hypothetical protein
MNKTTSYPHETRLDIHYRQERSDRRAGACRRAGASQRLRYKWYSQALCQVNESVVRLGIVQGQYHWHKHDDDDEFFYVVEEKLLIDLHDRTAELAPRQ